MFKASSTGTGVRPALTDSDKFAIGCKNAASRPAGWTPAATWLTTGWQACPPPPAQAPLDRDQTGRFESFLGMMAGRPPVVARRALTIAAIRTDLAS